MRLIERLVDSFMDELDGAKEYAECYVENKARGNHGRASKYKEMSTDELKHARYLEEMATADITALMQTYHMTSDEEESWSRAVRRFAECTSDVERMLEM